MKRSGALLLAVLWCGAVLAPFGHSLSHVRSLEHAHGAAAEGATPAAPAAPAALADFFVEEQTPPHHFECDLCASRSWTAHVLDQTRAPRAFLYAAAHTLRSALSVHSLFYRPIRAPPVAS